MSFELEVKLAVYRHFAETGVDPSCDQVAEKVGIPAGEVVQAYQRLRVQRVLVREDDGISVRMAPPFFRGSHPARGSGRQPFVLCQLCMGRARHHRGAAAAGDHFFTARAIAGILTPGSGRGRPREF